MDRGYSILNVFTDEQDGGNPLAVVTEAAGLSAQDMQAIAKRFDLSETVFVFPAERPAHTASIRIFTPEVELPFAGHPTLGAAVLLAHERIWRDMGSQFDALVVLEAPAGILRVGLKPGVTGAPFGQFDAPFLPAEAGEAAPEDRLAAALGLSPNEIGFENHKPSRYAAGFPLTFVPVNGLEAMAQARIVDHHWESAFGGEIQTPAYLYCRETIRHKAAFHARCFAPSLGMPEDPATGSAAAAFAGVIRHFDQTPEGTYEGMIEQGIEMGQPSEIFLEFEVENRNIRVVRIGGHAVLVRSGVLDA